MRKFIGSKRLVLTILATTMLTGAVAPGAQAADNGANSPQTDGRCEMWQQQASQDLAEAVIAYLSGRPDLVRQELGQANYTIAMARSAGCAWAARTAPATDADVRHAAQASGQVSDDPTSSTTTPPRRRGAVFAPASGMYAQP